MRMFPTCVGVLSAVLALSSAASGQGAYPLSGDWRFGSIVTRQAPLTCGTPGPGLTVEEGTLTMAPTGTFTLTATVVEICAGGTPLPGTDSDSGSYETSTNNMVVLDMDPQNPGTDTETILLRGNGLLGITSADAPSGEGRIKVAFKLSSGQSNGSLNGSYHVVRIEESTFGGLSAASDFGVITFDGAGAWSENGWRHSVSVTGLTTDAPYSRNGVYTILPDGTLFAGNLGAGAISADGEAFFWVDSSAPDVGITVGVRAMTPIAFSTFEGEWGFAGLDLQTASGPGFPIFQTRLGTFSTVPQTPATGGYAGMALELLTDPLGTSSQIAPLTGSWTLGAAGNLGLLEAGQTAAMSGALGPAGTFMIARDVRAGHVGIMLGIKECVWPAPYGTGTAGAGGVVPDLMTFGGYPYLGNDGFRFHVAGGRGGALAVLALSLDQAPGPGVLIDLNQLILLYPLFLSGPAGVPGAGSGTVFLPIPDSASLAGIQIQTQAGIFDLAAPQGLALTPGLQVTFCR